MKKSVIVLTLIILLTTTVSVKVQAQGIAISEDGTPPHNSAAFHIKSSSKGFLMPVMSSSVRNFITTPADGLQVYDTDTKSFWFYKSGTGWMQMQDATSSGWSRVSAVVYLTSSTDRLGIGTNSPSTKLEVLQTENIGAGRFTISNNASSANTFYTATNGTGNALLAVNTGTGSAGHFDINNSSNSSASLSSNTNGTGAALSALNSGTGRAAYFQVSSTLNNSAGIESTTNGSGSAGIFSVANLANTDYALKASTTGSGYAGGFFGGLFVRASASSPNNRVMNVENSSSVNLLSLDNTGALGVRGYTSLGTDAAAPAIKMKKFTGTTHSTQGGSVSFAHGLNPAKILSISVLVDFCSCNSNVPPGYTYTSGYEYDYYTESQSIYIVNKISNSGSILSRPFKVLVIYEQ